MITVEANSIWVARNKPDWCRQAEALLDTRRTEMRDAQLSQDGVLLTALRSMIVSLVAHSEAAPVPAVHVDGHRHIMHDLARIALISLQQEGFGVAATTATGTVAEDPLGTIVDQVNLVILLNQVL